MSILNMKSSAVIIGLGIIVIFGGIYLSKNGVKLKQGFDGFTTVLQEPSLTSNSELSTKLPRDTINFQSANNSHDNIAWIGDAAQVDAFERWQAARGWPNFLNDERISEYEGYSNDSLKKLGESGDIYALQQLAKTSTPEDSAKFLIKASVYGSTFALAQLAVGHLMYTGVDRDSSDDVKRPAFIEAASYMAVVQMRGDLSASDSYRKALEMDYGLTLSESDLHQVLNRAEEIYNNIQSERIALGLGEFDNSIPPIAESFYRYKGLIK